MSESKPRTTDVQKLQRAIVDGLEDVKGQDIVVFNTEHLSPLFERVIIASGTSNRQTKALASSVSEAVREAGFPKPRMEGEDNGEWIIVDCGAAVAHVMQPNIRQYYHLEEIWGGKTVRLKQAAETTKKAASADEPKPAKRAVKAGSKTAAKALVEASTPVASKVTGNSASTKVATRKTSAVAEGSPARKTSSVKTPAVKTAAAKAPTAKAASTKPVVKSTAKSASVAGDEAAPVKKIKTLVVGKPAAKKTVSAKGAGVKVPAARKSSTRKPAN